MVALRWEHAFPGDSSFGADMTIGMMCRLGDVQAAEKAVQLGLFLMCILRSEEYQPTDFSKSPPDMPIGHKPASKVHMQTNAHPSWRI